MTPALLIKRALWALPTLLGVMVVVFVLLRVAPGDPISMMIGPGATAEDIANLRALYGLDHSIATQFAYYLRDVFSGDFGVSISRKQPVAELIAQRLPLLPVFGLMDSDLRFEAASGFVITESLLRGRFDVLGSVLWHLLLPAAALALPLAAMIARVLKASLAG